ncbi:SLATT domain-containing protein [Streptomyces halstedii]|uniref:SLATT domain-containing protein n=1 Tax=Streptomyces halstedii TaxID=1944 RepID=UPI003817AA51
MARTEVCKGEDGLMSASERYSSGDLQAVHFPSISVDGNPIEMIRGTFSWVESFAVESINWYTKEKTSKARWSRTLRFAAVLFLALGTVAPVVAVGMGWAEQSVWGYGLIGLGACCAAIDKVFGFSSSWMRYMSTAVALNRQLLRLQVSWPKFEARLIANSNDEVFSEAIQELAAFVDDFAALMESETNSWMSEFQNHILQLETGAGASLPPRSP